MKVTLHMDDGKTFEHEFEDLETALKYAFLFKTKKVVDETGTTWKEVNNRWVRGTEK